MKRLLLFFAVVTLLASCTEDTTDVVKLSVRSQDWIYNSDSAHFDPLYYSYSFSMPEITSSVYSRGLVQVYMVFDGAQQALPYVQHNQDTNGVDIWNWTRTIDFQYSVGELTVFVTNSDFFDERPEAMDFRVVLIK